MKTASEKSGSFAGSSGGGLLTRRGRRRPLALPWLMALAFLVRAARVDAEGTFTWDAPATCPDEGRVSTSLARLHAEAPVDHLPTAVAQVRAVGDTFTLHLSLHARSGSTELSLVSRDCATLADVVALQLALAANAGAVTTKLAPPLPQGPPRYGVAVAMGTMVGPLPAVAPGLRASASLNLSALRIEVTASALLPTSASYERITPRVGARFTLITAGARVCPRLPREGFGASACVGFEAGGLGGAGDGSLEPLRSTQFWGAATAAPLVQFAFASGVVVAAEVDFGLAVTRPEFHARNLDTLFRADRTAAALWLGAGMHFD